MRIYQGHNRGIIKIVVIVVIALLVLSYFGYNIRDIANSQTSKDNFSYVGGVLYNIWNDYLKGPVLFAWNLFVDYVWTPAINNLKKPSMTPTALSILPSLA
jgi:hypothetical protein